jgi:catechol 2,3-dioxygenase-like lactoylglutathione lyase family enzyme
MTDQSNHALGPRRPTWTHIALAVKDVDATVAWYETFTHLRVLARNEDEDGRNAWIGDESNADSPFVLVAGQFFEGHDPFAPTVHPPLGPFAHIGIELPSKEAVDDMAARAKDAAVLRSDRGRCPSISAISVS